MVLLRLALSNLLVHRIRAALTIAAIALSVSLVVSVTSGYASGEAAAVKFMDRFMGTADALLTHTGDSHALTPDTLITQFRADPDVARITGRLEASSPMLDKNGKPVIGHDAQLIGLDRPIDTRIDNLNLKFGDWFNTNDANVCVIDQVAAVKLHLWLKDTLLLPSPGGILKLKVVGIVQKPAILAAYIQSVYVPLHTLQRFLYRNDPPGVNRVMIDLKVKANLDQFVARWTPRLLAVDPTLHLRLTRDNRKLLDDKLQGLHLLSYLGGMSSMLSATFIVFSALSMGVTERSRVLAMLRAVGATRSQVAILVVIEGLALSIAGVVVGVPLGWFWVRALAWKFDKLFTAGVVLSPGGVALGGLGSLAAAMAASLLPAWTATRVRPLEAMVPLAQPPRSRVPVVATIAGLLLASIEPTLMFFPWTRVLTGHVGDPYDISREIKFLGHFALGLPGLMLGFFLLAPAFVMVLERVAGPAVAGALRLRYAFVRQQMSNGVWRAAGTCAALMVGLSLLVAMEVQGKSLLSAWQIPDKFPDIFIVSLASGLDNAQVQKLAHLKGIKPGELLPVAVASPQFGSGLFSLAVAGFMPDATMFFGLDPAKGMKMMELDFREGNPTDAVRLMNLGRHILVTDEFRQLKHLGLGDKVALKTARHGTVDYTIAGVVWSPGIDVIVSMFDMGRQFDQRTAASIFGSMHDAKEDFGVTDIRLFAANLDYFTEKEQVLKEVKDELGVMGMQAGDVRQIKQDIQKAFGNLLLLLAIVPMGALVVASLGVTNTIMASVRTRQWQFGVLRSIGFTRSQLLRLVISEAMLVGVVGAALGLTAGLVLAVSGRELIRVVSGTYTPLVFPWGIILVGCGSVVVIAVLASLWPAISVARTSPLTLLQAGRAST